MRGCIGYDGEFHEAGTRWQLLGKGHRVYSPALIRLHSPDNLSPFHAGGINAYGYCGGDPVNNIDPDGRFALPLLVAGVLTGGLATAVSATSANKDVRAVAGMIAILGFSAAAAGLVQWAQGRLSTERTLSQLRSRSGGFSTAGTPKRYVLYSGPPGKPGRFIFKETLPPPDVPNKVAVPRSRPVVRDASRYQRRNSEWQLESVAPLPDFSFDTVSLASGSSTPRLPGHGSGSVREKAAAIRIQGVGSGESFI